MTRLAIEPRAVSNWFHDLLDGIAPRKCSFTDIDRLEYCLACNHDGHSIPARFLFQEFKRDGEECRRGQKWALADLARTPHVTVWLVVNCGDGCVLFYDMRRPERMETLSVQTYIDRYRQWWNKTYRPASTTPIKAAVKPNGVPFKKAPVELKPYKAATFQPGLLDDLRKSGL